VSQLNISKVAVGCASLAALARRQQTRLADGVVPIVTRFRPKRADALIGGSLFWIIHHRIVARQTIVGFGEEPGAGRTIVRLDPPLIAVRPAPRRAHQGWRYLSAAEAPPDLGEGETVMDLPAKLERSLALLALI
jgi:hypothetical protein